MIGQIPVPDQVVDAASPTGWLVGVLLGMLVVGTVAFAFVRFLVRRWDALYEKNEEMHLRWLDQVQADRDQDRERAAQDREQATQDRSQLEKDLTNMRGQLDRAVDDFDKCRQQLRLLRLEIDQLKEAAP